MKAVTTILFTVISALFLLIYVRASAVTPVYFKSDNNENDQKLSERAPLKSPEGDKSQQQDRPAALVAGNPEIPDGKISSLNKDGEKTFSPMIKFYKNYIDQPNAQAAPKSLALMQLGLGFLFLSIAGISRSRIIKGQ